MSKVILDPTLRARLNGLNEQVEICDESGKTLGHFLPHPLYRQLLVAYAKACVSDEELERRMQEPGGCSFQEIWQRLGNV